MRALALTRAGGGASNANDLRHRFPLGSTTRVIMVDDDGAVVIPQKLVPAVAAVAAEQERLEEWIMTQVNDGASLPGLYPPNAENKARYEAWSKHKDR